MKLLSFFKWKGEKTLKDLESVVLAEGGTKYSFLWQLASPGPRKDDKVQMGGGCDQANSLNSTVGLS